MIQHMADLLPPEADDEEPDDEERRIFAALERGEDPFPSEEPG